MTLSEYASYDALGLADLVKRGEVSAAELATLALGAVAALNPTINAVVEVYEARKLKPLVGADAPFAGVPFFLKDFGAAEVGREQAMGSRLTKGYVSPFESVLTTRFKRAGLTVLGRTATPEFALSLSTESEAFGPTRNPWDLDRLAGGSSGGAGASVAAGLVPIAHATDAAGSIRIPASACGLVGLKPSRGRVSVMPSGESVMGMNTEFVLCRSVRDAAAMLDAVAGPAPDEPLELFRVTQDNGTFSRAAKHPPRPLRIAYLTTTWATDPVDPVDEEVAAHVERTAGLLEELGHEVESASPTFDYQKYLDALCVGWAHGFDDWLETLAKATGRNVRETVEPVTLSLYDFASSLTLADAVAADETFAADSRLSTSLLRALRPFAYANAHAPTCPTRRVHADGNRRRLSAASSAVVTRSRLTCRSPTSPGNPPSRCRSGSIRRVCLWAYTSWVD